VLQQIVQKKTVVPSFEFLVVGNNSRMFSILVAAMSGVCGHMSCASSANSAMDYIARRKVDGIVIDMNTPGAVDLLERVRRIGRTQSLVVFACIASPQEEKIALQAGANFVLNEPLESAAVAASLKAASRTMVAEQRRFFRYPLMLPVELKLDGAYGEGTMINLSEGGMAIWDLNTHALGTALEFFFTLPFGGDIQGQGEIVWAETQGNSGVRFHLLPDDAYAPLYGWLSRRDRFMFSRPVV
jgi:CheY-like chemotaxis protein